MDRAESRTERLSMQTVYLSLGSNLGDRADHLRRALTALEGRGLRVRALSSVYETTPVGETSTPSPRYLNQVVKVETSLPPLEMLRQTQAVERDGGRERSYRWAPRTIDIDVLLYGDLTLESEELKVPHPRMYERAFVLAPLAEIDPDLVFPDGSSIQERLSASEVQTQLTGIEIARNTDAPDRLNA